MEFIIYTIEEYEIEKFVKIKIFVALQTIEKILGK